MIRTAVSQKFKK